MKKDIIKVGILAEPLNKQLTGVGYYSYNLIKELVSLDSISTCLINYKINNMFPGVNKAIISMPFNKSISYFWYPYVFITIKLRGSNLDIIHSPTQIPTFFKLKKQKSIITVHDLIQYLYPNEIRTSVHMMHKILLPRTLKNADIIIADSYNTKYDLMNHFNISDKKIKVIYLAVNDNFLPMNKEAVSIVKKKYDLTFPYILYVGTLELRKNIPTLIKAYFELKRNNIEHKLVITGKKGWKHKEIYEKIEELNLRDDIIFTGYIPDADLPGVYNGADLFVYPSLYEGFGLPPLEAMACGCPVITSNASSLPEVIGDAGIMFEPHDTEGLAKAMYKVLTNVKLREYMIKKGLERSKKFSWEKVTKEILNVYMGVQNIP